MDFLERGCGCRRLHISSPLLVENVYGVRWAVVCRAKGTCLLAGHYGITHLDCAIDLRLLIHPCFPLLATDGAITVDVHRGVDPDLIIALASLISLT